MSEERYVFLEGDRLSPPSREPVFPADLEDEERVRVTPAIPPTQEETRFWRMDDAYTQHPNETTFAWKNQPDGPYGRGEGLARLPETCVFEFEPKKRALPDLWRHGSIFVVSGRLFQIFMEYDPDVVESRQIVMKDPSGTVFNDSYRFVDVTRSVEFVDYANSVIIYGGGGYFSDGRRFGPFVSGYPSVRILPDADLPFHLVRHKRQALLASDEFRRRVQSMKPKVRNVDFDNIAYGI